MTDRIVPSWQDVAERWKRAYDEDHAKLERIRDLIRDDRLIEVMGTEYIMVPEVLAILDGLPPGPKSALKRGDRIIFYEGMGEYSLGVFLQASGSSVRVRLDGYITPEGEVFEPYELTIGASHVHLDNDPTRTIEEDAERMLPGYIPIPATLTEKESGGS